MDGPREIVGRRAFGGEKKVKPSRKSRNQRRRLPRSRWRRQLRSGLSLRTFEGVANAVVRNSGQPLRVKACPLRSPLPLSAERRLCSSVTAVCPHQSMQTPRRSKPTSFNAMTTAYSPSRSTLLEPIFLEARVQRAGASKWPSGWGFMSRCLRQLTLNPSCAVSAPAATTFGVKASPTAPHSRAEGRDLSAN
jgi:hypothetical protein